MTINSLLIIKLLGNNNPKYHRRANTAASHAIRACLYYYTDLPQLIFCWLLFHRINVVILPFSLRNKPINNCAVTEPILRSARAKEI